MLWSRSLSCGGNWSEKRFQFSSPTWFLKVNSIYKVQENDDKITPKEYRARQSSCCRFTFWNISFRSSFGADHDATASQKKMKSGTTPAGLTVIIWHIPLKAESFSSLSLMLRREVHLLINLQSTISLDVVQLPCPSGKYFDQWNTRTLRHSPI